MLKNLLKKLPVIFFLTACGDVENPGSYGSNGGGVLEIPSIISWVPPTQNTDYSNLTDLAKYRFYYGPSSTSLEPVPQLDLEDSTGIVRSISIDMLNQSQKNILMDLLSENSTHFFAMKAVNNQNIESDLSNIVQYFP